MLDLFDYSGKKTSIIYERKDNVVSIKRKLRDIIYINEIQLQLFNEGEPLPDNGYLTDHTTRLDYQIIEGDSSDIIIKVARNNYEIPKLIQINKEASIEQLEIVLTSFSDGVENLAIFTESGKQLENHKTVEQSRLVNESEIRVCDRRNASLSLSVANILPVQDTFTIQCYILDTVYEVKERICHKLNLPIIDEMAVFSEFEFLETERQLIDYFIKDGDLIFYVDLLRKDEIQVGKKFKSGKFASLHYGRNQTTNTDIVVKKYSLRKGDRLLNFKPLKYEIITFLQLRSEDHPRFITMDSMLEEKSKFFIGMEYMKGGSLNDRLPLNSYFKDPEETIINFSIQILEGLAFLHEKRILYRSMKCSSVLLDSDLQTVKLCNFHLSKFMLDCDKQKLLEGMQGSAAAIYNWAPPEMLLNQPCGVKADIWSFGATLIEMVTGRVPYADFTPVKVRNTISESKKIKYVKPEWMTDDLKYAIKVCLKPNQADRPSAKGIRKMFLTMKSKQSGSTDDNFGDNKI